MRLGPKDQLPENERQMCHEVLERPRRTRADHLPEQQCQVTGGRLQQQLLLQVLFPAHVQSPHGTRILCIILK